MVEQHTVGINQNVAIACEDFMERKEPIDSLEHEEPTKEPGMSYRDEEELPSEILEHIFSFIDYCNQCQIRRVCIRWRDLLQEKRVLRRVVLDLSLFSDGFRRHMEPKEKLDHSTQSPSMIPQWNKNRYLSLELESEYFDAVQRSLAATAPCIRFLTLIGGYWVDPDSSGITFGFSMDNFQCMMRKNIFPELRVLFFEGARNSKFHFTAHRVITEDPENWPGLNFEILSGELLYMDILDILKTGCGGPSKNDSKMPRKNWKWLESNAKALCVFFEGYENWIQNLWFHVDQVEQGKGWKVELIKKTLLKLEPQMKRTDDKKVDYSRFKLLTRKIVTLIQEIS